MMARPLRSSEDGREAETMSSLRMSGIDLTGYHDQLVRARSARTLSLRRQQRKRVSMMSLNPKATPDHRPESFPFLEPSVALGQVSSPDASVVIEFLRNTITAVENSPKHLEQLMDSPEFVVALINQLNSQSSVELSVAVMQTLGVLFPFFPKVHKFCVDEGLCMSFYDFLTVESEPFLSVVAAFIGVISESSGYARDAILCCGIHSSLIAVALKNVSEKLDNEMCDALHKIFANAEPIDPTVLIACLGEMIPLLSMPHVSAVSTVLGCFVEMTNKMVSLVFNMYDMGLFPLIVDMLSNPELVGMALPLIGNMSVGHAQQVQTLLECNLFETLMYLLRTEYAADVLWVFSNLVESAPYMIMSLFDAEFIEALIDIAESSGYEVKKEGAFFLATLILFTEARDMQVFMTPNIIDLMTQMLGCSIGMIILRCLDALLRFSRVFGSCTVPDELMASFHDGFLRDALTELLESRDRIIFEKASFLLRLLEMIEC